jgi:K+-transporting ATPase ATPase C chain
MNAHVSTVRALGIAARLTLILTVVLGVLYPLLVTGVGQLAFGSQANGSLVRDRSGLVVGSRLIGQAFSDAAGNPLPTYFQPRPSAAGDGYDTAASGGSNRGPESRELIAEIRKRRSAIAAFNGVAPAAVPADALTASGSGLDPDISPAYAAIQIDRVARARGLAPETVRRLVATHTQGRDLDYLGQPRVNVLELNLALDNLVS